MLAILLTLMGSVFADSLTVSGIELQAGDTQEIAINLNNSTNKYVAFQFDVILPEGISIAKNDKGKLMVSLNADRTEDHTLNVQDLGSGTYRLLSFSMSNSEFYGTSGPLVNMTLQADENISVGTKEGLIKSQVFTQTSGSQVKWDDVSFSILLTPKDEINTDYLSVSNIELQAGKTQEMAVDLNNSTNKYVAFQFDVVLPEGISIAKNGNGKLMASLNADRIDDHTLSVQNLGSGTYRLLSFSMTNSEFYGTTGALVNLTLQSDKDISEGTKEGLIQSQVFTKINGRQVKWNDVTFSISVVATVVPEITADDKTREYGEDNPELTYSVNSELIGEPELTTTATKMSPVGEYDIIVGRGTIEGDFTAKNGKMTITKAPLTISVGTYTIKQGEPLPTFNITYEGFKNNETESVLITKPAATTSAAVGSAPGEYDITLSGGEAQNYELSYINGKLIVVEADPVVVTANSYNRVYGDANPTFGFTSEGAMLTGVPEITCEATDSSPVGTYPIVISKGSVTNYNDTYVNGSLTITKAPLNVKAENVVREQYQENPEFVITYTGWKVGDDERVLISKPIATTSATKDSPAGEYDIIVSGGEAENYNLMYQNGTLTVITSTAITDIMVTCPVDIYTLQGYKVRNNTTTLEGLPKGVYVVNGHKVVVK